MSRQPLIPSERLEELQASEVDKQQRTPSVASSAFLILGMVILVVAIAWISSAVAAGLFSKHVDHIEDNLRRN